MRLRHSIAALLLALVAVLPAGAQDRQMTDALMNAYTRLLDEDPRDPETLFRRASLYYKEDDYVRALDDLNNALKYYDVKEEADQRVQAMRMRADVLMAMGKYDQALEDINFLLSENPQNFPLLYERGTALYETGRYPEAEADFNTMLRINPRSQEAMLALARVAVKRNNLGLANDYADRAVGLTPGNSSIYMRRAGVRTLMGNRQGAVEDYIQAISIDSENTPRALGELVAISRVDYPVVMAGLSGAISKAPRNGMFYFIRAMIAQGHANYPAAIRDYDLIINENLDSYPGLNAALAECYYSLGKYDTALLNADFAISATEDNAYYYVLKSNILRAKGDSEGALEAAVKALDKQPEMVDALVAKALAQVRLGMAADASVALSEAEMTDAASPRISILRGWVLGDYRKQKANAERAYDRVLDMDIDHDNVRSLRGFAMLALDRLPQARQWMERVLAESNDYDGEVNYYGACFYSQCGETDKAFECMENALAKGYANYHDWTLADEANLNCAPLRDDPRFKALLDKHASIFQVK